MKLESLDVQHDRRQRAGYYDRHLQRQAPTWKDWMVVLVVALAIVWLLG